MNRRLLLLAGAVPIVALLVVFLVLGFRGRSRTGNANLNASNSANSATSRATNTAAPSAAELALRTRIVDFSERYESGPSGTENLRLLAMKDWLTPNLGVFAQAQARQPSPKGDGTVAAAKALTTRYSKQTASQAEVAVDVQRTATVPTKPDTKPVVTYVTLHLSLLWNGSAWLVGSVNADAPRTL